MRRRGKKTEGEGGERRRQSGREEREIGGNNGRRVRTQIGGRVWGTEIGGSLGEKTRKRWRGGTNM